MHISLGFTEVWGSDSQNYPNEYQSTNPIIKHFNLKSSGQVMQNVDYVGSICMNSVSVAMAVYNGGKYLSEQIDSILSQIQSDDELVVSYDKSNDNTWDIVNKYALKDKRVRVYRNNGSGVASNFSNAILHCKGKYIFISDQDDVWLPNKISISLQTFEKTNADIIIHNGIHTDETLKPISGTFFNTSKVGPGKIRNLIRSRYSGCCMAIKGRMKDAILPIPTDIDAYDRWIALMCEFLGKVYYIDDVLIYHRLHGGNVTPTEPRPWQVIVKARLFMIMHLFRRLSIYRRRNKPCK